LGAAGEGCREGQGEDFPLEALRRGRRALVDGRLGGDFRVVNAVWKGFPGGRR